jgi:hypothetical protein
MINTATQSKPNDREWVKNRDRNEWVLHLFPFFLSIEQIRHESRPFVGSLKGALCTYRDLWEWASLEEAKQGLIIKAMDHTMEIYQQLGEILQGR